MLEERSYGIIPLSSHTSPSRGWEVFLIQHKHARYWGFPKGHAESGETPQEAAARELKEETNLEILRYLSDEPLVERYQFMKKGERVSKEVYYFVAEVVGRVSLQAHEIQDGGWFPLDKAFARLTHAEGRSILSQVAKILPSD